MWFSPSSAWIISIFTTVFPFLSEKLTSTLSEEHWANRELQRKDRERGMSEKQIARNAAAGRYYIPKKQIVVEYPVPHREPDGHHRVRIENWDLYYEDAKNFGAWQADQWLHQGKYNLNEKELAIIHLKRKKKDIDSSIRRNNYNAGEKAKLEEIETIIASSNYNYRNTEASQQWKRAHDAESK